MRSTGTTDIREARVIRDRIMYEFFTIRDRLKPKPQGNCVVRVLKELRQVDQYVTQNVGSTLPRLACVLLLSNYGMNSLFNTVTGASCLL